MTLQGVKTADVWTFHYILYQESLLLESVKAEVLSAIN